MTGDNREPRRQFKTCPIGYFHIDIAQAQTAEGKALLSLSKGYPRSWRSAAPAGSPLRRSSGQALSNCISKPKMIAARFLRNLVAAVLYAIHTVLTDNPVPSFAEGGIQSTNMAHHTYAFHPIFDRVCDEHEIDRRLTKIKHPWTNGQSLPPRRRGSSG